VAEDEDCKRALLAELVEERPSRIDLSFLDATAHDGDSLREIAPRYRTLERTVMRSPYIEVDGDWDAYWARRPSKLRGDVGRLRRRLEKQGEVSFDVLRDPAGLKTALEEALQIEASGWKGENGTAIQSHADTAHFYRRVVDWAADDHLLALARLRVDGKLVAFSIGLEDEHAHYGLKTGYDSAWRKCGPGVLLTAELIAHTFGRGLSRFELLGNEDPYKARWTDGGARELQRVQSFAPSPAGIIERIWWTRGRAAAKRACGLYQRLRRR
jgi:CelD/BcsL family acetyltransferase involved in cellulose biosynthesis